MKGGRKTHKPLPLEQALPDMGENNHPPPKNYSPEKESQPAKRRTQSNDNNQAALLQTVVDTSSCAFSILKPIRNEHDQIVDFEWVFANKEVERRGKKGSLIGQRFTTIYPGVEKTPWMKKYISVIEENRKLDFEDVSEIGGKQEWFHVQAEKIGENILMTSLIITELKKSEQEVLLLTQQLAKTATEKYFTLFNSINQGFCIIEIIWDERGQPVDYRFIEVNAAFEKQTGIRNAIGRTMREIEPAHESNWFKIFGEVFKTGVPKRFEQTAIPLMGGWYDVYAFALENGQKRVAVLFDDITVRKKGEEVLVQNEARLEEELKDIRQLQMISRSLVEGDNVELFYHQILDAAKALMDSDMCSLQILHHERKELFLLAHHGFDPQSAEFWKWVRVESGSNCAVALSAGDRIITPDVEQDEFAKNSEDFHHYRLSGIRAVQSTPLITRNGIMVGMISTHWKQIHTPSQRELQLLDVLARQAADLLERNLREEKYVHQLEMEVKQRTEEIVKQHAILQQAEELTKAGSWEYDVNNEEFLWSDGMYELFELEKGLPVRPSIYIEHAIREDRDIARKVVDAIQLNFQPFEETLRIRPDGTIKTIKVKAIPLKNDKGDIEKMIGADIDNTSMTKAEEQIIELNRSLLASNKELSALNSELKSFSSNTAINFSEALRHVYINLETVVTTDARYLSNSSRANLRRAQASIQKIKLLSTDINNYLQLYDLGLKKELINPNTIIQNVISNFKGKIEDVNATINLTKLPPFIADPLLFSRLMTCLIDNAIKFRKLVVDPVIKISYSRADELNSIPHALKNTPYIIITVTDNGTGFDEGDADKIFELFTQLQGDGKQKGSGIGLTVCKKIMEMHRGFITAESEKARSASFHCYFPD